MNKSIVIGLVVILVVMGGIWFLASKNSQPVDQMPATGGENQDGMDMGATSPTEPTEADDSPTGKKSN